MAASQPQRRVTKVPEIRRGDTVVVLTGKDAGKRGTVERIVRFRLPPGHRSVTILASARYPATTWRAGGRDFADDRSQTVSW